MYIFSEFDVNEDFFNHERKTKQRRTILMTPDDVRNLECNFRIALIAKQTAPFIINVHLRT